MSLGLTKLNCPWQNLNPRAKAFLGPLVRSRLQMANRNARPKNPSRSITVRFRFGKSRFTEGRSRRDEL